METEIKNTVIELISRYSDCPVSELTTDVALSDTGIESVGVAELIFDLEDRFDITIEDSDDIQSRFNLGTVQDVINLVSSLATENA